jgi:hypothetical protein
MVTERGGQLADNVNHTCTSGRCATQHDCTLRTAVFTAQFSRMLEVAERLRVAPRRKS